MTTPAAYLRGAADAAVQGDHHKAIALTGIALTHLAVAAAEQHELVDSIQERPVHDYLSPCPAGFNTVIGYMAIHHPAALEIIEDIVEGTQRDGFWLTRRCRLRYLPIVKVCAPLVLQELGIREVNAYPEFLLEERMGC